MHIIFHATVEWSSFPFQNALWAIFIKKVCSNFNKPTSYLVFHLVHTENYPIDVDHSIALEQFLFFRA